MKDSRIDAAVAEARERLAGVCDSPALDAELLLAHVLDKPRTYLRAWPEHMLDADQTDAFEALLARRTAGEPLAYVLGRREFWSLDIEVAPGVLIPRADTETLVERALELIPADQPARVADLGTGSGAIALAIAGERPLCTVVATDRSPTALDIARRNAERLNLRNVEFQQADWCSALGAGHFDLIVSNPPYIATDDPHLAQGDLPHEPTEALTAGPDGLDDLRRIVDCTRNHLRPGGHLLLEHGYTQGEAVHGLLRNAGFEAIRTHRDLEGRERISEGLHSNSADMRTTPNSGRTP
ncbi:MAG: peptide chain release factor N(5)-glutamine methyltransferase [Acidihalobacter sp.]|uniref:peptide chain release factor N(5)-glutamine methyltransferase n=1 Tax=Acidihalobacter sp. TaxID=1872108 RepID=UPI00307FBC5E